MEDDGFQLVRRKKRNRPPPKQSIEESTHSAAFLSNEDASVDAESLKRRIRQCWNELVSSQYYATLTKHLDQAMQQEATYSEDSNTTPDSQPYSECLFSGSSQHEEGENVMDSSSKELGTNNRNVNPEQLNCPTKSCKMKQTMGDSLDFSNPDHSALTSLHQVCEESGVETAGPTDVQSELSLLVYGLGNFASCLIARYQLALVLALRQHLKIRPGGCETYDPRYTDSEKQILVDLGLSLIDKNEEGKRPIQGATVVVMPHCGQALFNNLLWANWSPQQLQQLVVFGNSFSNMLERLPRREWQKQAGYIADIQGHMREESVENSFTYRDIFNDLSVHWFPAPLLSQLPSSVWSQAKEPSYDVADVEIILQSQS